MSPELQDIVSGITLFLCGLVLGYSVHQHRLAQEIKEWREIARKAQRLNTLAETLEQKRNADAQREYKN